MSRRVQMRELYIAGWYELDADKLLASTRDDFVFDDPMEPEPVGRAELANYMHRWDSRTRALGSNNQWRLTEEVRQDRDGFLIDWEWWELLDTPLQGAAVIKTSDEGVVFERITYFDRTIAKA